MPVLLDRMGVFNFKRRSVAIRWSRHRRDAATAKARRSSARRQPGHRRRTQARNAESFRNLDLAVHITTVSSTARAVDGRPYILPCLGGPARRRAGGQQSVTVEDSIMMVHASRSFTVPPGENVKSRSGSSADRQATLKGGQDRLGRLCRQYDLIRGKIEAVFPRLRRLQHCIRKAGFHLPNSAALRIWKTEAAGELHRRRRYSGRRDREEPRPAALTPRAHDQL
jgi:hypothetical protein